MHIVEQVSLVDFYRHEVVNLERQGFLCLVLALVREADAPEVYRDLSNHWKDLHDLTGRRVLFAVAGGALPTDANDAIGRKVFCSSARFVASPPQGLGLLRVDGLKRILARQHDYLVDHPDKLEYGRGTIDPETLGDNSIQVTELRQLLGISEIQTPCLHFTVLCGKRDAFVIPLGEERSQTLWGALKRVMAKLSNTIDQFESDLANSNFSGLPELESKKQELLSTQSEATARRTELLGTLQSSERVERKLSALWADVARLSAQYDNELLKQIGVVSLLDRCRTGLWTKADRAEAFDIFGGIKKSQILDRSWNSTLQALIDVTHDGRPSVVSSEESTQAALAIAALNSSIQDAKSSLARLEPELQEKRAAMLRFLRDRVANDIASSLEGYREAKRDLEKERWDYFVSYPKVDRHHAIKVWRQLSTNKKCFLDTHCLRPAIDWEYKLETALARSDTAVIVVTPATRRAYYQVAEIQRAVNHYRAGHLSLAVFKHVDAELPLGLEPIQHVLWSTEHELGEAVESFISH